MPGEESLTHYGWAGAMHGSMGAVSLPWGASPGLKGDAVGETDQMVVRQRQKGPMKAGP